MNRAQRRGRPAAPQHPPIPATWGETWERCPFRSLVSLVPGTRDELMDRIGATFAALGGEIDPIDPDGLTELVDLVRRGRTVLVMGDRADLQDAAKAQLMAAVSTAMVGAAGSA